MSPLAWPVAFAVVAVVHLVLNVTGTSPWDSVTKCLLAPLLAAWVLASGGPRILVLALAACVLGDLFLELTPSDTWFLPGMAAFAAAHVCFVAYLVSRGAVDWLADRPLVGAVYVAVAVALVAWVWGGLEPGLRVPVAVYALLLTTTAVCAWAAGPVAAVGGLLFLVSDALIALDVAGRWTPAPEGLWIMLTYALAIGLLVAGSLGERADLRATARA
jgi:uncharacterized membrane protein YhhN